jgi:hypothetical protein
VPDPQQQTTSTGVPAPDDGIDLSGLRVRTVGGIDLSGLRFRTIRQAQSEFPQPTITPPWEEEPTLPSAPTSKLGKAYADAKQWLSDNEQHVSEKYLAPFREGLDRLGEDLQQAGESGHTPAGGALTGPTRALVSGVGSLLKAAPVGRDIKSTALAWAAPPELPEGNLSRELNAWDRTGKELGTVYHGGKTTVGEVDPSKLQQRDAGFYGPGFYVTKNEQYAKTYGNKVSQKTFNRDAKILDVDTIHPGYEKKVSPELQKEIEATERAYLAGLPKAQKNPNLVNDYLELINPKSKSFDLHSWIEAVNRHAEQKGYDAIRFSDGEIVVKNPKALATDLSGFRTRTFQKQSANNKELPPQPRLPDTGSHAAIKTDDGSIYFDDAPEKQRTHIMLAKDLGIPPERVVSGGWLTDGEYEGSERSDASRWGEQARAKAAVAEKRATLSQAEQPTFFHGTDSKFTDFAQGRERSATGNPTGVLGTYFTNLPEEAERYVKDFHGGKGKVVEANVNLKNPYEMSLREFQSLSLPWEPDWKKATDKSRALREKLESEGHDGIVVGKGSKYQETIVFDPQNIKTKGVREIK